MKQPIKITSSIRLKDFDPAFCDGLDKEVTREKTTKLCQRASPSCTIWSMRTRISRC